MRRMKLIGAVEGIERYLELEAHIGRYLQAYEPAFAKVDRQWIWTTDDPEQALALEVGEMLELWRTSIGTRPWDGKPDRPITVFHVEIASA